MAVLPARMFAVSESQFLRSDDIKIEELKISPVVVNPCLAWSILSTKLDVNTEKCKRWRHQRFFKDSKNKTFDSTLW